MRKGPGWRYASSIVEGSNKVLIYNHGHGGRSKHYSKYGYGINQPRGRKKGLKEKCDWYSAKELVATLFSEKLPHKNLTDGPIMVGL